MNNVIKNKIESKFKEIKLKFNSNEDLITFNIDLEGVVGRLSFYIQIFDKSFVSYAVLGSSIPEGKRSIVAEYLHRANYGLRWGNFEIDFDDGEVRYKMATNCDNIKNLTDVQIIKSVFLPCQMFEMYGEGILKLIFNDASPKQLIEEAESDDKND